MNVDVDYWLIGRVANLDPKNPDRVFLSLHLASFAFYVTFTIYVLKVVSFRLTHLDSPVPKAYSNLRSGASTPKGCPS